jgi:DNA-binding LacI/PurR family transcriptional regulator
MADTGYKKDILYEDLKRKILSGFYQPGHQFPKELELARQLKVAKVTVRSAFAMLEDEKLIRRVKGSGTFVSEPEKKRGDIIIVVDDISRFANPAVYLLEGINKAASANNVGVRVCERPYIEGFTPEGFMESVKKNNVSGILLPMGYFTGDERLLELLRKSGVPVVLPHAFGRDYEITGFASVQIDFRAAWKDAVAYLAENHKRVASLILSGNPDIRGYTEEEFFELLETHGLSADPWLAETVGYNRDAVSAALSKWRGGPNPPTAILCFSDFFAIYVYETLRDFKLRVPNDIAVMGFCGYPGAGIMSPPLSTVDFEYRKMGETAVRLLLESDTWFQGGSAPPKIIKQHTLVKRESTAVRQNGATEK